MNVGESLKNLLFELHGQGYNVGNSYLFSNNELISALRIISSEVTQSQPFHKIQETILNQAFNKSIPVDFKVVAHDVSYVELKAWLGNNIVESTDLKIMTFD